MKRIIAIFLAAFMVFALTACNSSEGDAQEADNNPISDNSATGTGFNTKVDSSAVIIDGNDISTEITPGNNITCTYEDEKCQTTVMFIFEEGAVIEAKYDVTYYTEEDAKDSYNYMMSADEVYYDVTIENLNVKYCDTSLVGTSMDKIIEMCEALGEWTRD